MTSLPVRSAARTASNGEQPHGQVRGLERFLLRGAAAWTRLTSWEFWPSWSVYLPLVPWLAWLSWRHGGVTTCTACNPGIPLSGLVGESKSQILSLLPAAAIVGTELIPPATVSDRLECLHARMTARGWQWPIILKPDVGQRGTAVKLIHSLAEADRYLRTHPLATLAQEYHEGPYEAGVFYVRVPGQRRGQIFSITDKQFPMVTGDGRSTLRTLIWRHPRYRCQADLFLRRLGERAEHIPSAGQSVRLGLAGNHCQGTMFLDGASMITPELLAAFDAIASRTPGFYFGRLDVRYRDPASFRRGEDFRIVELNGLLSESTNIYDPRTGYWQAQRTLRRQWQLAYHIGSAHRRAGIMVPSLRSVWNAIRQHLASKASDMLAD